MLACTMHPDRQQQWRTEMEILPQEFLRQASAFSSTLSLLVTDGPHDVLSYVLPNGQRRVLIIGKHDHLLQRVESLQHLASKGDRLEWTEFSNYQQKDGRQFARTVRSHIEEETTQWDTDLELAWQAGGPIQEEELRLEETYRAEFPEFAARIFLPEVSEKPTTVNLGDGVYLIELEEVNSRSLLVEFADYSIVIESGGNSEMGQLVLQTAARLLPTKPVRYLAMSHHHRISASGIRPYVQAGITLLATEGNVDYLHDLGIDVEFITQTWPLEENYEQLPFETLEQQVRLVGNK